MNVSELVAAMSNADNKLLARNFRIRLVYWARRVPTVRGFWRLARYTGLAAGLNLIAGLAVSEY